MGAENSIELLFDILKVVRYNNFKYVKCPDETHCPDDYKLDNGDSPNKDKEKPKPRGRAALEEKKTAASILKPKGPGPGVDIVFRYGNSDLEEGMQNYIKEKKNPKLFSKKVSVRVSV
jgi:hypothetical protein